MNTVFCVTEQKVAIIAQQSPHYVGVVVVVDAQTSRIA
jgi:adenosine/AMP kinase